MQISRFSYIRIAFLAAFLLSLTGSAYSQDTGIAEIPYPTPSFADRPQQTKILPYSASYRDKNLVFLDSLKEKASKNRLTRKLYEIVIVAPDSAIKKNISGKSEMAYAGYSGKKIRKIDITRLSVFGSDIDDPASYKSYRGQNLLNRTHVNTLDMVIRNNLLFRTGDTLSPILLSDNERLLRDLSYIDDARIKVIPVSRDEVDILVITKDVYSIGGDFAPSGLSSGNVSLFDNNIFGLGHELGFEMPFNSKKPDSPGFGVHYLVDNIAKTFVNLRVYYHDGLGEESYGLSMNRKFFSSSTRYAGGLAIHHMYRFEDLDTMKVPEPLRYNFQDFWLARSFLLDVPTVSRLILSARYTNNNVFERPYILPDSYHPLQRYQLYMGSIAFSRQRYYKSSLVYEYGRTEDIPYGSLLRVTAGREINEFKTRNYLGTEFSFAKSITGFGYLNSSAGFGSYLNKGQTEQGIIFVRTKFFSNLLPVGRSMIRNFVRLDYTRGFDRNLDEHLKYYTDNGFSGFRNDSARGGQRITVDLETVIFSPVDIYGFRFAFFGFAEFSSLSGTNQILSEGTYLSGIGAGIRVRNDNLIFNTFQIRIGFFPHHPGYSRINNITVSGEQPLRMDNFDTGAPAPIPFR